LCTLLDGVINIIRVRMLEKPLVFMIDVDPELPAQLIGDEIRIRQILINLLSNAVKYTPEGTIKLKVYAEGSGAADAKDNLTLVLEVSDSGIGIKDKDKHKLFTDFSRLDMNRNKNIEGTGLGLAITKNICRIMGGGIHVASKYGKGSVFRVTIPQGCIPGEKLATVEDPESKAVLLYNYQPEYTQALLEILKKLGVPACAASGPDDFLEKLSAGTYPFAIVSTDFPEHTLPVIREKSPETLLTVLADIGDFSFFENAQDSLLINIPMPVHAVSIAKVLNGKYNVKYREGVKISFTAPKAKLLVVDDINTNLKVAEGLLLPYKAEVDTCLSGAGAIELFKSRIYDIVFMDHMMPGMDGIEAAVHPRYT